jgi:hypothetical protein
MTIQRTSRFEGTFVIDSWDQQDGEPSPGLARAHARVAKTFSGDLSGTSRTELMMAGTDGGSRSYCGFEQVTGTVAGLTGTFVLRHAAEGDAEGGWMTWTVLPGSGTGELAGVRGEGQITRHDDGSHTYWLDLSVATEG